MDTRWKICARVWACLVIVILSGCGEEPISVVLTAHEEAAIYRAIFRHAGGIGRYAIHPETSHGYSGSEETLDCDWLQTRLIQEMPTIKPEIIPAFCAINSTTRPINPEVITLLGLKVEGMPSETFTFLKLSSIQTDSKKTQALVCVDLQSGEFVTGSYLLLTYEDGLWKVLHEWQTYIS